MILTDNNTTCKDLRETEQSDSLEGKLSTIFLIHISTNLLEQKSVNILKGVAPPKNCQEFWQIVNYIDKITLKSVIISHSQSHNKFLEEFQLLPQ